MNTHLLILQAHDLDDGRWIAPSASFPGEDEVLFAPNTKFVIKDVVASDEFDKARFISSNYNSQFHVSQKIENSRQYQTLYRAHKIDHYIKKYIYGEIIP
ncbi:MULTISPECIES: hypothetical protein [unclassified Arsenophonus]|uniref:hypothetical protein n=1 Tax=unclassified Arsenophonus TaxID=2627083 RepID=UPI00285982EF|nr:hypothetical protein [Arsenophonus sp.]MDR5609337.1 hypothetical protein [Arsenophonus sp.]MDR5613069.1 hypothetical protein [Arsenophonus sp.]